MGSRPQVIGRDESYTDLKLAWPDLGTGKQSELIRLVTQRVTVGRSEVCIVVSKTVMNRVCEYKSWESEKDIELDGDAEGQPDLIEINVPVVIKKNGSEKVIVLSGTYKDEPDKGPNANLIRCLVRAHDWVKKMQTGELESVKEIAEQTGMNQKYLARMLKVAFLAPDITEAILDEKQPSKLTVIEILKPFPACWSQQRRHFGFA